MQEHESVIAVFSDHDEADKAIKELSAGGFGMKNLSVVGKGFHTEEKVIGFYTVGDRIVLWGTRGAFWGAFWGFFMGGVVLTVPVVGQVVVLGTLAAMVISSMEGALILGGLSGLAGALYGLSVPRDSVVAYEAAVKSDGFLVMAHGSKAEIEHARQILQTVNATSIDVHTRPDKVDAIGGLLDGNPQADQPLATPDRRAM